MEHVQGRRHPVSVHRGVLVDPYSKGLSMREVDSSSHFDVGSARCATKRLLGGGTVTRECANNCTLVFELAMSSCRRCYCITSKEGSTGMALPNIFRAIGPTTGSMCPVCGRGTERCALLGAGRFKAVLVVRMNTVVMKGVAGLRGGPTAMGGNRRGNGFRFKNSAVVLLVRPKGIHVSCSLVRGARRKCRAVMGVNRQVKRYEGLGGAGGRCRNAVRGV